MHKCGVRNGPPFIAYWASDSVAQPDEADVEAFFRATYREALRNVPEQERFPFEVTWPAPPDEQPAGQ
ncbi:phage tail assembly chaperone [Burkholderia ambifaria]|uniref:phage tail assembly chaperone n=1 Tax=Burkholderia ambifaria TaxID=152480 RepID=UPI002FDF4D88